MNLRKFKGNLTRKVKSFSKKTNVFFTNVTKNDQKTNVLQNNDKCRLKTNVIQLSEEKPEVRVLTAHGAEELSRINSSPGS